MARMPNLKLCFFGLSGKFLDFSGTAGESGRDSCLALLRLCNLLFASPRPNSSRPSTVDVSTRIEVASVGRLTKRASWLQSASCKLQSQLLCEVLPRFWDCALLVSCLFFEFWWCGLQHVFANFALILICSNARHVPETHYAKFAVLCSIGCVQRCSSCLFRQDQRLSVLFFRLLRALLFLTLLDSFVLDEIHLDPVIFLHFLLYTIALISLGLTSFAVQSWIRWLVSRSKIPCNNPCALYLTAAVQFGLHTFTIQLLPCSSYFLYCRFWLLM